MSVTINVNEQLKMFGRDPQTYAKAGADGKVEQLPLTVGFAIMQACGGYQTKDGREAIRMNRLGIRIMDAEDSESGEMEFDKQDAELARKAIDATTFGAAIKGPILEMLADAEEPRHTAAQKTGA
ncbi:MAG: hypothetical protein ACKV2Q_36540 [Planctomycetaceae bacterium]